ncbi:hypothetical protein FGO68_gene9034 [Halteria grandinella]|uniref:Transmembrane protein n=1 Tax=Halteria grandinella TaxID=5974 RepID=A0A8J8NES3_HALGN|nr:hypothetical protein FGO68_gene9034 [Halteria grandinella]
MKLTTQDQLNIYQIFKLVVNLVKHMMEFTNVMRIVQNNILISRVLIQIYLSIVMWQSICNSPKQISIMYICQMLFINTTI